MKSLLSDDDRDFLACIYWLLFWIITVGYYGEAYDAAAFIYAGFQEKLHGKNKRPTDVPVMEADIHKLQKTTGWMPEIRLEQTIQTKKQDSPSYIFIGKTANQKPGLRGCGYAMVYKPLRLSYKHRRFECHRHAILKIYN